MIGNHKPLFEICDVCGWMFDEVAQEHPDKRMGGNYVTFNQAKENYKKIGKIRPDIDWCRPPLDSELPENNGE